MQPGALPQTPRFIRFWHYRLIKGELLSLPAQPYKATASVAVAPLRCRNLCRNLIIDDYRWNYFLAFILGN